MSFDPIRDLKRRTSRVWNRLLSDSPFFAAWRTGDCDRSLLALYYIETYHYTLHNARNQAMVGVRHVDADPSYVQFCFEHAQEETGHELMAFKDLRRVTEQPELKLSDLPPPLPATEVLTGYIYWVSQTGSPVRRLGYSFWAEDSYEYFMPTLQQVKENLGLSDSDFTFLIAHANIDEKHAEDVHRQLRRHCHSKRDWDDVGDVMETSLVLTGRMLDEVHAEWRRVHDGESDRAPFVKPGAELKRSA